MLSAEYLAPAPAPAGESAVIETSSMTKTHGARAVVDGLAFRVPAGFVSGFVGPDGAGTTTTIRMLWDLVRPSSGSGGAPGSGRWLPGLLLAAVGGALVSVAVASCTALAAFARRDVTA